MVIRKFMKRFRRDENGAVLVEGLLSMPIVMLMTIAMVECGMLLFQWNLTVKALQIGARFAAVSDPLISQADYDSLTGDTTGLVEGDPLPTGTAPISCGAGAPACEPAGLARLMTGGDDCFTVTFGAPVGICDIARFIQPENIRVTYHQSGLGYVGRPFGVVTTITVELRNQYFDFLFLDAILPDILGGINIPAHPVTITSEDISDCTTTCI